MFIFPYGLVLCVILLIIIIIFKRYAKRPYKKRKWERREAVVITLAFICAIVIIIWLR